MQFIGEALGWAAESLGPAYEPVLGGEESLFNIDAAGEYTSPNEIELPLWDPQTPVELEPSERELWNLVDSDYKALEGLEVEDGEMIGRVRTGGFMNMLRGLFGRRALIGTGAGGGAYAIGKLGMYLKDQYKREKNPPPQEPPKVPPEDKPSAPEEGDIIGGKRNRNEEGVYNEELRKRLRMITEDLKGDVLGETEKISNIYQSRGLNPDFFDDPAKEIEMFLKDSQANKNQGAYSKNPSHGGYFEYVPHPLDHATKNTSQDPLQQKEVMYQ